MKKIIFILMLICSISLFACNKKEEMTEDVTKTPKEETPVPEFEYTNKPGKDVVGGYVKFVANRYTEEDAKYGEPNYKVFQSFYYIIIKPHSNTIVTIELGNVDNLDGKLGEFQITLTDGRTDFGEELGEFLLDWTTDHIQDDGKIVLNLSKYFEKYNFQYRIQVILRINLKRSTECDQYMLIKSIVFTDDSDRLTESEKEKLTQISFTDANDQVLQKRDEKGIFPYNYWRCNGFKELYNGIKKKN